jgi:ribosomal protein S6
MSVIAKNYRLTYLISAKLEKEAAAEIQEKLVSFLKEKEAEIKTEKEIKLQKLAYPIQKEKTAYLADLIFNFSLSELPILKKYLEDNSHILRFLLEKEEPKNLKKTKARLKKEEKSEKKETVDEKLNRLLAS